MQNKEFEAMKMEYEAIRAEILKRIELRQLIMLATLTIAGVFFGFGAGKNFQVILLYPVIAAGLALCWNQVNLRIGALGLYIRHYIVSADFLFFKVSYMFPMVYHRGECFHHPL